MSVFSRICVLSFGVANSLTLAPGKGDLDILKDFWDADMYMSGSSRKTSKAPTEPYQQMATNDQYLQMAPRKRDRDHFQPRSKPKFEIDVQYNQAENLISNIDSVKPSQKKLDEPAIMSITKPRQEVNTLQTAGRPVPQIRHRSLEDIGKASSSFTLKAKEAQTRQKSQDKMRSNTSNDDPVSSKWQNVLGLTSRSRGSRENSAPFPIYQRLKGNKDADAADERILKRFRNKSSK